MLLLKIAADRPQGATPSMLRCSLNGSHINNKPIITIENAPTVWDWIKSRGGVAVWKPVPKISRWQEGSVDRKEEHFELCRIPVRVYDAGMNSKTRWKK